MITTVFTKGDLLAELDKEPFEDAVAVKKAAVDTAEADLQAAIAAVRGVEAQARSLSWQLQNAIEDVDNRVALLKARVAALDKSKATLKLAQLEFDRAEQLLPQANHKSGGVRSTASRTFGCAGGRYPSSGGCPSNPCLFGVAGAARKRGSRRGATRSRSDFLFRSRGAGSSHPDGGAAWRCSFL